MSAYVRFAAASALAVSFAIHALPAAAADLYDDPPRGGYGYNDGPPPDRYAEPPADFEPPYPPPAYAERGCVPREVVRDRMRAAGWYDFHAIEPHDRVVLVKARRPSGRLFDLTIDRCSGELVDARPIFGRRLGPFAYGPRRYWPGPY